MNRPQPDSSDLPDSRLYTFIDERREFALYFLEGQRLIHDLAVIHPIRGRGFAYFRDVVLSIQPMIAYLKRDEQLGFYIDSESPWFRLKIETSHHGATRCSLMPEDFREFPEAMHGVVRLLKLFPRMRAPYQSVLRIDGEPLRAIVNRVLRDSYQVNSAVLVSQSSDQSVMLHQLPPLPGRDEYVYSHEAVRRRRAGLEDVIDGIFHRALVRPEEVENAFSTVGFRLLAGRIVRFRCSCSRDRMIQNLATLTDRDFDDLFVPGAEELEITCDYCKARYRVSRRHVRRDSSPIH